MTKPIQRPQVLDGYTVRVKTACGTVYVTCNTHEGRIVEIFLHTGKAGGCIPAWSEALGRLVSTSLRAGVELSSIIKQLKGIRCPDPTVQNSVEILSCPDAVATAIETVAEMIGQPLEKQNNTKEVNYE